MTMNTGAGALAGIITKSRITGAGARVLKSPITGATGGTGATAANRRVTAMGAAVITANHTRAGVPAGITTSLMPSTITTVMNTASGSANRTTGATMREDTVSLTPAAGTGAAPRTVDSLSARVMRSGRGSAMRRPSGDGAWTKCARGTARAAARGVTSVPTSASAKT